ncbi:MAG: SUMF1/EgtB/PvdO family nonheme iron enzyme [Myxococcota bacterium]|nr:SUMF1/EgtB/PvdO family nonheme iron enzyme [Myxococcota bacterium]
MTAGSGGTGAIAECEKDNPQLDIDLDGYAPDDGDCNDCDARIRPQAKEICDDGIDQNCDGKDLECDRADQDLDGVTIADGDCDDQDGTINPTALETCDDGIDQDCDGQDLSCDDVDDDGDGLSESEGDCDDTEPRIRMGLIDECGNGIDEDCNGIDKACISDSDLDGVSDPDDLCVNEYDPDQADSDGDGVGDACDNCPTVANPDQANAAGGQSGDACNETVDTDGDGVTASAGDCQPTDPSVFPGASEACNGVDDDCNGFIDDNCPGVDLRTATVDFEAGPSLLGSNEGGTGANQDAQLRACLIDAQNNTADANCDEIPQKQIELSSFAIEIHEVTNRQYAACMAAARCTPPADREKFDDPAYANHPVVWINQVQATTYCAWAGGRLPTEAQWERVARSTTPLVSRPYLVDGQTTVSCDEGNLIDCERETRAVMTTLGDRTADGVFDLIGNVHEHTRGWYDPSYYRTAPLTDPPGAEMPQIRPGYKNLVSVRGGSYLEPAIFSTITYRGFRHLIRHTDERRNLGFRCVR